MKVILWMGVLMIMSSVCSAQNLEIFSDIPKEIADQIRAGQYADAQKALGDLAEQAPEPQASHIGYYVDWLDRVKKDFTVSEEKAFEDIKKYIPTVTMEDLARWRKEGSLWYRIIDGKNMYYNRGVNNLFRLDPDARKYKQVNSDNSKVYLDTIADTIKAATDPANPYVLPQRLRIEYSLSVKPNVVPPGKTIKCWLLYPRECNTQKDIKLIESTPELKTIAPPEQPQRTLYFEQPAAAADQPTEFKVVYEYTASAYYRAIDPATIKPYDENGEIYKTYTVPRDPHLVFTPEIVAKAKEIVGDEKNPYLKSKLIYDWIQKNIKYVGMLEYCTVPNLSEWCFKYRQGDCGVFGLLFVVLCRASGVPARWQSGWAAEPGNDDMHDWAEFYVEPYGWLHSDPSRGYIDSPDPRVHDFHFGNFDHYRLIANGDYGRELDPPKKSPRSEPVDFQRGEVEWEGGNLYYDNWNWKMNITEVK